MARSVVLVSQLLAGDEVSRTIDTIKEEVCVWVVETALQRQQPEHWSAPTLPNGTDLREDTRSIETAHQVGLFRGSQKLFSNCQTYHRHVGQGSETGHTEDYLAKGATEKHRGWQRAISWSVLKLYELTPSTCQCVASNTHHKPQGTLHHHGDQEAPGSTNSNDNSMTL